MGMAKLLEQLIALESADAEGSWDPNDGRWITMKNGQRLFIVNSTSMRNPGRAKPGRDVWKRKDKKGKVVGTQYSEKYDDRRSKFKYARAFNMAKDQDRIGRILRGECGRKALDEKKATATVCLIMQLTGMRVGEDGESNAKMSDIALGVNGPPRNPDGSPVKGEDGKIIKGDRVKTYGASTMPKKHVKLNGNVVQFHYMGKSGIPRRVRVEDEDLAGSIRAFMGGDENDSDEPLFMGLTNRSKALRRVQKFNKNYLNKDFRTAVAMRVAADETEKILKNPPLLENFIPEKDQGKPMTPARLLRSQTNMAKHVIGQIATAASSQLGNDPKMAQKSYISPEIFEYALEQLGLGGALKATKDIKQRNRSPVKRSKVLPTKYIESKEWKPPATDASLDAVARGVHAINERGESIKKKMPVLVKLFGEKIVKGLVDEFLSDGDTPRGGLKKLMQKES